MTRHATTSIPPSSSDIISPKETTRLTSLSPATIWRLRQRGEFPDPVRLSPGRMGWRRRDVDAWLSARESIAGYLRPSPNPLARPRPARVSARRKRSA